jgi:hypothetical protein
MSSKQTKIIFTFALADPFFGAYSACAKTKLLPKKLKNQDQNDKILTIQSQSHSRLPIVALWCKATSTPRDRKSHTWAPFPVNKIIYQRQTTSAQFAAAVYCVKKVFYSIALTFVTNFYHQLCFCIRFVMLAGLDFN